MNVLHIAAIPSEGKPRYRVKPMMFVPHDGMARDCRASAPGVEKVRLAAIQLLTAEGADALLSVLGRFGADCASAVPVKDRRAAIEAMRRDVTTLDCFAEILSWGQGVTAAARQVGCSGTYGNAMLQRIRKRLGPQAI